MKGWSGKEEGLNVGKKEEEKGEIGFGNGGDGGRGFMYCEIFGGKYE